MRTGIPEAARHVNAAWKEARSEGTPRGLRTETDTSQTEEESRAGTLPTTDEEGMQNGTAETEVRPETVKPQLPTMSLEK